jgi:hypothetical protein
MPASIPRLTVGPSTVYNQSMVPGHYYTQQNLRGKELSLRLNYENSTVR